MRRLGAMWHSAAIAWLLLLACSRSPHSLAPQISRPPIPSDARVLSFEDRASGIFAEDLFARVELEVMPAQFEKLMTEALRLGYKPIDANVQVEDTRDNLGISDLGVKDAAAELSPGG